MVEFLMLGIIPGTNIQITFGEWMRFVLVLCTLTAVYFTLRRRRLFSLLIALSINRAVRRFKPTALPA